MTTHALDPNNFLSGVGMEVFPPDGDPDEVVHDSLNSTWVIFVFGGMSQVTYDLTTFTLGTDDRIIGVRSFAKYRSGIGSIDSYLILISGITGEGTADFFPTANPETFVLTISGATHSVAPGNLPWTQAEIDVLQLRVQDNGGGSTKSLYSELWVEVYTNGAPVTTVTGPTGTLTTTTRPNVTWSYVDPDGDAQAQYRVKVFTSAQYGAGGFDPETSAAAWDSGNVVTSGTTALKKVVPQMPNGIYRAYVKVADAYGFGQWAYSGYTQSVTLPITPTLTATEDPTNGRVHLVLGVTGSSLVAEIEVDRGAGFVPLLGATDVAVASGSNNFYDYSALGTVSYRARVIQDYSTDDPKASNWSTTATVTLTQLGWWLKNPADPTKNVRLDVNDVNITVREPQGGYSPLGRTKDVVMSDGEKGDIGKLTIWSKTATAYAAIRAFNRAAGTVLLVDGTLQRQWFVHLGETTGYEQIRSSPDSADTLALRHMHKVTLNWTEVSEPS